MPSTCKKCSVAIPRNNERDNVSISCCQCNAIYHIKCSGIDLNFANKNAWKCLDCSDNISNDKILEMLRNFEDLRVDLTSVKNTVGKMETKLEDVVSLTQATYRNQKDIEMLKKENNRLRSDMSRLETVCRQNNVVITGVPEMPNENLQKLILSITGALGCSLERSQICKYTRFRSKGGKQKPILVVLNNYYTKNELLTRFKHKKQLIGSEIGLDASVKIHIGEHVNSYHQKLMYLAKQKLISIGKYKYLWIQNGDVLIRKTCTSKIVKIKSEDDINKLL